MSTTFRAGDHVRHVPSREDWILAYADGDYVSPCGWPETLAQATDCVLVRPASDQQHREMLEEWAGKSNDDRRAYACRRQLFMLNEGFVGAWI